MATRLFAYRNEADAQTFRRMTPLEKASLQRMKLEQPFRENAMRTIWEKEGEISTWAVDTHCELQPGINAPKGSLRRKKGYEDGRYLVRALGNCVRLESSAPLIDEILAWYAIGDPAYRITAKDVEYFLSFVHQGCRRALAASDRAVVDELMEESKALCRNGGASWLLKTNAKQIAHHAVELLQKAKLRLNEESKNWIRTEDEPDYEEFLLALADALSRSPLFLHETLARWIVSRIFVYASCPVDVWLLKVSALQMAILDIAGIDAAQRIEPVFSKLRDDAQRLKVGGVVMRCAAYSAHQTAQHFFDIHSNLDAKSPSQYVCELQRIGEQLLTRMAILYAGDLLNRQHPHTALLWCDHTQPYLPFQDSSTLKDYVSTLLEHMKTNVGSDETSQFYKEASHLLHVIDCGEQSSRLSKHIDSIPALPEANENASKNSVTAFPELPRLMFLNVIERSAVGRGEPDIADYRRWLYDIVLPRLDHDGRHLTAAIALIKEAIQMAADQALSKTIAPYLDGAQEALLVWKQSATVMKDGSNCMNAAIAKCFEIVPDHPMRKNGETVTGSRDGTFLIDELLRVAAIGKTSGKNRIVKWYRDEIAWNTTLPGMSLQAFIDGLIEGLKAHPTIVDHLKDLRNATPFFTAAKKIYLESVRIADLAADVVISKNLEFKEKIGPQGKNAYSRDNGMCLRALAASLAAYPLSNEHFTAWYKKTIAPYIRIRNNDVIKMNQLEIAKAFQGQLDQEERKTLNALLTIMGKLMQTNIATATTHAELVTA